MKNIIFIFLFALLCSIAAAQGEIDTQEKILFQNERSISLSLNTNGFGAGFRYGKRKTYLNKVLYDIEVAYIKHPKEAKVSPDQGFNYSTTRRYVPGKMNLFVNVRPSIGFQKEIYSKEDKGSIAIRYYYGAGPSLGFCKPVYYTFDVGYVYTPPPPYVQSWVHMYYTDERYDYTIQGSSLMALNNGRASFGKGLDEIKFYPGLHAQFGISFEYGSLNQLINAIDVSATLDAFAKKIPIMLTEYNNQFFFTLSLTYRFGWIVDAKYKALRKTEQDQDQILNQ